MSSGTRIPLADATAMGMRLLAGMQEHCHSIVLAGSVRRGRSEVGDLEVVALPRYDERPNPRILFGDPEPVNLLHEWAVNGSGIEWIKPGTMEVIPWQPKPDGKYWRARVGGLSVDVFIATPQTLGYQLMLRTGSLDFNREVARYALRNGLSYTEQAMRTPGGYEGAPQTEAQAFELLRLRWIEPAARNGAADVRVTP